MSNTEKRQLIDTLTSYMLHKENDYHEELAQQLMTSTLTDDWSNFNTKMMDSLLLNP